MPVLIAEVDRRLRTLSSTELPPNDADLVELVRATLGDLDIELLDVRRAREGKFLARWRRLQGVLTEETGFTLLDRDPTMR